MLMLSNVDSWSMDTSQVGGNRTRLEGESREQTLFVKQSSYIAWIAPAGIRTRVADSKGRHTLGALTHDRAILPGLKGASLVAH